MAVYVCIITGKTTTIIKGLIIKSSISTTHSLNYVIHFLLDFCEVILIVHFSNQYVTGFGKTLHVHTKIEIFYCLL